MYDLSVILATRNRERLLDQTLAGLAGQIAVDLRWEVIVVDNGSTDGTADVLRRWETRIPLTTLHEPVPGKNRALNRALPLAKGEFFAFTDDDIIPDPHWLRELYDGARRWPDDMVFGGKIIPRFPTAAPPFLRADDFRFAALAYSRYVPQEIEGPVSLEPIGPNLMIHRRVLDSVRYAEQLCPSLASYSAGSETELLMRLHQAGHRFVFLPGPVVEHVIEPHQMELGWLLDRAIRFGQMGQWIAPEWMGPTLFSVPRYLWRRLGEAVVALGTAYWRGRKRRWEAMIHLWHTLGAIRGSRERAAPARGEKRSPLRAGIDVRAVG